MADRNVTFLIIARDFASRTLNNVSNSTDRAADKLRNLDQLGIRPVIAAGAALGPALLPVLAGAAVGAVGLGTALLGAGAAAGVFGAVTASVFGEVLEASQKSEALRDKLKLLRRQRDLAAAAGDDANAKKYEAARVRALYEYRARLDELPTPMRNAVLGMDRMRFAWEDFVTSNRTPVLNLMARGFNVLAAALPYLQPLFDVAARAAGQLMGVFERFVSGGGLERLVSFLAARAGPAFTGFGRIIVNFGRGFGALLAPWARTSDGMVSGLERVSAAFAQWAATDGAAGMERILGFARREGPGAAAALGSLAGSVGTLAAAAAPLAPVSAAIALALSQIIEALPQPVLTGLIASFIAWNLAVSGARLATLLFAGASRILAAGVWVMNSALLASPITWIVLGIAALAAGFIYAYRNSVAFRTIVQGALSGVLSGARNLIEFFRGVPGFFSRTWTTITGAFTSATTWIGGRLDALVGWVRALPGRVMGAIAALPGLWYRFWFGIQARMAYLVGYGIGVVIRTVIRLPGQIRAGLAALPGIIGSIFTSAWNRARALVSAGVAASTAIVRRLPGLARSAVSSLWSNMQGAFSAAWSGARSFASRAVRDAVAYFRQAPGQARSALSGLPGQVKAVFSGAGGWLVSAGGDIIRGLVQGIGNMAGAAVEQAKRIASSIVGGVKAGLGIGSPSRVMADQVGRWIPPGIIAGIKAATPGMLGQMSGVMDRLVGVAGQPVVGRALLNAEGYASAGGRRAGGGQMAAGAEVLQPIVLQLDGKTVQTVLLKLKRDSGGVPLGLA